MKITCDYNRCTGNGLCEDVVPDYFRTEDNGDLTILREDVDPDDLADIERAVISCPTQALAIVE